jgi:RimJ/RimL family protein N-acetyltransferase
MTAATVPQRITLEGRLVRVEPLEPSKHAASLWDVLKGSANDGLWTYLFDGPYRNAASFEHALARKSATADPLFFAIVDRASDRAVGYASLMRIEPVHRVIEVGSILFSPLLQRTAGATEAMYVMARYVFEVLSYRRYEWKCDSQNEPSRRAALRLGFKYEGTFRKHMIVKGKNRDTAWYSILDSEWPERKAAFERWLDPANFDEKGAQLRSLT